MKILNCIHSINPEGGGPATFLRQLSELQSSLKLESDVVSLDSPEEAYCADFPGNLYALGPGLGNYGYQNRLPEWLHKKCQNYDLTIIHGLWQYHSLATWEVCSKQQLPYAVFPHGMLDPWFNRAFPAKHLKKQVYWLLVEHRIIRDAQAVLFTAEDEQAAAKKSFWPYACHAEIVPLGSMAPPDDDLKQKEAFLQQFPQLRHKRLLLFLSRIHSKKGVDLLLEAFAEVSQDHADLHLVLAGPCQPDYKQVLEEKLISLGKQLNSRVTFTGMLDGDVKWGAFRSSEALILPSHQENFALVISEALSCALPVLISNKVNIWRTIEKEQAGLVAADDLAGTRDLLQKWLSLSIAQKETMAQSAKRCFDLHFEFQHSMIHLVQVLKKYT